MNLRTTHTHHLTCLRVGLESDMCLITSCPALKCLTLGATNWSSDIQLISFHLTNVSSHPVPLLLIDKLQVVANYWQLLLSLFNKCITTILLTYSQVVWIPFCHLNFICLSTLINHWIAFFHCPAMTKGYIFVYTAFIVGVAEHWHQIFSVCSLGEFHLHLCF